MTSKPLSVSDISTYGNRRELQQYLRFHLVPDTTVMLPLAQLTEVLTIPLGQIVPIPQMPTWVMGVYNWRGEILWMIDLGHLLGLTPWYQQTLTTSFYRAVVLHSIAGGAEKRSKMLGLVVSAVEDLEWCNPQEIKSPPDCAITPSLVPYLRGYWLKPNGDMLITLDGEAILASMPKP